MTQRDHDFGTLLERWLDHLDRMAVDGRRIGIRERLSAHSLLRSLREQNELPPTSEESLALLAPLICISPDSQRRYRQELREFLAEPAPSPPGPPETNSRRPVPWLAWLVATLILGILVWSAYQWLQPNEPDKRKNIIDSIPRQTNEPVRPNQIVTNALFTFYTNQIILEGGRVPVREREVRILSRVVGGLTALGLAAWCWWWLQGRLYLRETRTDREVEERILGDPLSSGDPYPADSIRRVARGLRQRVAGNREVLHIKATLRATLKAGGAFSPRFQRSPSTPEYVVLVDRRHPRDLFAQMVRTLATQLQAQGVAVEVYVFDGSPSHGCRRWKSGPSGESLQPKLGLSDLALRLSSARILVFAEATTFQDPLTGRPQPWATLFSGRPEKAWFTPAPLESWGSAESLVDQAGFLVLPARLESLDTLVAWLGSDQLRLVPGADWPLALPPLLQEGGIAWVARQTAPEPKVVQSLLYELQNYLGPIRYQWLCACAIFPALSPALTQMLGRQLPVALDARGLTLGLLALGGLPFFRHGRMPPWLRAALVAELRPETAARYRKLIEERLGQAVDGEGPEVARLAVPQSSSRNLERLWAWLGRGTGLARDVVMLEFLRPGHLSPLVQRLPEPLRRRLFRNGMAAHGVQMWLLGLMVVMGILALATPQLWSRYGPSRVIATGNILTGPVTVPAFTNSLGMVFLPITIPASATGAIPLPQQLQQQQQQQQQIQQQQQEGTKSPQSAPTTVWFSVWETRYRDFEAFATNTGFVHQEWKNPEYRGEPITPGPDHPVVNVDWDAANEFCSWLTQKDLRAGLLQPGQSYRLPTDLEWSAAVGLPTETGVTPQDRDGKVADVYPWGTQWPPPNFVGNYADEASGTLFGWEIIPGYQDGHGVTAPVATYPAQENGIYDLGGNVWEWCQDYYNGRSGDRVLRGASWDYSFRSVLLSSCRGVAPNFVINRVGFRVVLSTDDSIRTTTPYPRKAKD